MGFFTGRPSVYVHEVLEPSYVCAINRKATLELVNNCDSFSAIYRNLLEWNLLGLATRQHEQIDQIPGLLHLPEHPGRVLLLLKINV